MAMRRLAEAEIVQVWERDRTVAPAARAMRLLELAVPDADPTTLTIGARDDGLLELHEATFGPELVVAMRCPACGEDVDAVLQAPELRARDRIEEAQNGG